MRHLDDLAAGSVENEVDMDDVEDLSQSVGADIVAFRGLLDTLDLLGLSIDLGDSLLDSVKELDESFLLGSIGGGLDSLFDSLLKAFKVSGLDVVSVKNNGLLGFNRLDLFESLDVSLSANRNLLESLSFIGSESSNFFLSLVVLLEDLLAFLRVVILETSSDFLLRLLLLFLLSLDLSLNRVVMSDSVSFLSSSKSVESFLFSLNSLFILFRRCLLFLDGGLELFNSGAEGFSVI